MKTARFYLLVAALILATSTTAFAPIFGSFPGLPALIERSDAVVVLTVLEQKNPLEHPRFGIHEQYKVSVHMVLKGDIPTSIKTVSLRHLPLGCTKGMMNPAEFYFGQRLIVFLAKRQDEDYLHYENLNYEGSHMQISPIGKLPDIQDKSPQQIIRQLLQDYIAYRQKEIKIINETVLNPKQNPANRPR